MATLPPSDAIRTLLEANSIGVFASQTGWGIYVGVTPNDPNTIISIFDTGGLTPDPALDINYPGIQIIIRSNINDYSGGWAKAQQVKDRLLGFPGQSINGDVWASITMNSDILYLGQDDLFRPMFSLNFQAIIHQGDLTTANRRSC